MKIRVVVVAILSALLAYGSASAQIPGATNGSASQISPEKRELIKELATVTRVGEMAEKSATIMLDQFATQVPGMLSPIVADATGSSKDKEALDKAVAESSAHVLQRIKDLLPQKVNLAAVMEEIFYPLYDKYFTEQELKDLVAFYKSSTGQKSIQVMPDLLRESLEKASELMNSRITELVRQVFEEEKQRLQKK